jgi:hypothetical protein
MLNRSQANINGSSFEEILRCANELRDVECLGLLFGERNCTKTRMVWNVESAHAAQLEKTTAKKLIIDEKLYKRAKLSLISDLIGDYHSHVPYIKYEKGKRILKLPTVHLSDIDKIDYVSDNKTDISVVIALKPCYRETRLEQTDFVISGYIRDNKTYRFSLGAYYFDPIDKWFRKARISVPRKILKRVS